MIKSVFSMAVVVCLTGNLFAQDTATIVRTVKVVQSSAADKKSAETKVQTMIGNCAYADSLYSGTLFWIGPKLWEDIKDLEEFRAMHLGNLALPTPVYNKKGKETGDKVNVYGKLIQSRENYIHFWEYVCAAYNIKGGKIVPMNDKDKFIYYQYYSQLEEPLVVIETNKGRLLLKFKGGKLMFAELTEKKPQQN
ncbi:hypothetical protein BH11BAC7_BH11BAC7_35930 [soil metagenome]